MARTASPAVAAVPGTLLLHPVVLIFLPVLVTAILEFLAPPVRRYASTVLSIVMVLTELTFVFMLLVPAGGDGYRWLFGSSSGRFGSPSRWPRARRFRASRRSGSRPTRPI